MIYIYLQYILWYIHLYIITLYCSYLFKHIYIYVCVFDYILKSAWTDVAPFARKGVRSSVRAGVDRVWI